MPHTGILLLLPIGPLYNVIKNLTSPYKPQEELNNHGHGHIFFLFHTHHPQWRFVILPVSNLIFILLLLACSPASDCVQGLQLYSTKSKQKRKAMLAAIFGLLFPLSRAEWKDPTETTSGYNIDLLELRNLKSPLYRPHQPI